MKWDDEGHVAICHSCSETLDSHGKCRCTRRKHIPAPFGRRGQAVVTVPETWPWVDIRHEGHVVIIHIGEGVTVTVDPEGRADPTGRLRRKRR